MSTVKKHKFNLKKILDVYHIKQLCLSTPKEYDRFLRELMVFIELMYAHLCELQQSTTPPPFFIPARIDWYFFDKEHAKETDPIAMHFLNLSLRQENPPKQQYKYQLFVDSLLLLEKTQNEQVKLK